MKRVASHLRAVLIVLAIAGCASENRPLKLTSASGPAYPAEALAAGLEGFVVVRYDVSVEGRVVNARAVAADPPGVFEAAAISSVSRWLFTAPMVDGRVVPVTDRESRVTFKLDDGAYADY